MVTSDEHETNYFASLRGERPQNFVTGIEKKKNEELIQNHLRRVNEERRI